MHGNGDGLEQDRLLKEDTRIQFPPNPKKRKGGQEEEEEEDDEEEQEEEEGTKFGTANVINNSHAPLVVPSSAFSTSTSLVPASTSVTPSPLNNHAIVLQSVQSAVEAAKRASGMTSSTLASFSSTASTASANAANAAAAAAAAAAGNLVPPTPSGWQPVQPPFTGMLTGSLDNTGVMHILDEKHDPLTVQDEDQMKKPRDVFQSVMECGQVDKNGIRRMTAFSPFFGKEVQIYTAVNDPEKRVLYRASALAEKFNCATNKIGMYLSRRRNGSEGIFQATRFKTKPSGRTGLKSGGYFVSFAACKAFETHYKQQGTRKARPAHHDEAQFGNYFANMQYNQFAANPGILNNYLGYPGANPALAAGMAGSDGRLTQFQQQMYMYNQLARLRMGQMGQPGFKAAPQQYPQQPPNMQQILAQLQAAAASKQGAVPAVATTATPVGTLPGPTGMASTASNVPSAIKSQPSNVSPVFQPPQKAPHDLASSSASAATAASAAVAAAAAAATGGSKPREGDVSSQLRAFQQQQLQNYVLQAQRMAYMQQMYAAQHQSHPMAPQTPPAGSSGVSPSALTNTNLNMALANTTTKPVGEQGGEPKLQNFTNPNAYFPQRPSNMFQSQESQGLQGQFQEHLQRQSQGVSLAQQLQGHQLSAQHQQRLQSGLQQVQQHREQQAQQARQGQQQLALADSLNAWKESTKEDVGEEDGDEQDEEDLENYDEAAVD